MKTFKSADHNQGMLLPYDVQEWLPEDHMARFVVDIVKMLDFKHVYSSYRGTGSEPYDPRLLLGLIFYGYSTGVFSSRKIEEATWDSVAFRFIAGNHHPDHSTISDFRKRFLPRIKVWFKEILLIGKELGFVKMGKVYIDGTKVQANASKHKAMSYEYLKQLEKKLEEEIETLLDLADKKDEEEKELDLDFPDELKRREERLLKIREAKEVVEERASERYSKEKEEYDKKLEKRKDYEEKTGKKPRGREPKEPDKEPKNTDQYNFTDPESRIMKTSDGFGQCYNAQAAVTDDMIIVGGYCNAHVNDKQEFIPVIDSVPEELGDITDAVADTGYFSEDNIEDCQRLNVTPVISTARDKHNTYLENVLNPKTYNEPVTAKDRMNKYLSSEEGRNTYKNRKQTVEPVFGIIKEILGFRRFSLRGEFETDCEWSLVCTAYNLKRFFKLSLT